VGQDNWNDFSFYAFVKLDQYAKLASLDEKLIELSKKYLGDETSLFFTLYPVTDIHLKSDYTYEAEPPGSERAVVFLRIISLFILLIAWVNYVNLSTARAVNRAKEVGLRKIVGAIKGQLISQFLLEAVLVNLLAALLALLMSELLLHYFNQLVGKQLLPHVWNQPPFLLSLLAFFFVGTFVSGFYPALVLSGFRPIEVLKGKFRNARSGARLRKGLVVVQFAASVVLIAATFIVFRQVQFMQGRDLGISTDYVVGVSLPQVANGQWKVHNQRVASFSDLLQNHVAVETVGGMSYLPGGSEGDIDSWSSQIQIVGVTNQTTGTTYVNYIDDRFLSTVE
ncbi:MAG: FtsX-like permease family protein, partial [Bacteroidota bacterium]